MSHAVVTKNTRDEGSVNQNHSTGHTPFELMFGRKAVLPLALETENYEITEAEVDLEMEECSL
jgi:hypothetical protein